MISKHLLKHWLLKAQHKIIYIITVPGGVSNLSQTILKWTCTGPFGHKKWNILNHGIFNEPSLKFLLPNLWATQRKEIFRTKLKIFPNKRSNTMFILKIWEVKSKKLPNQQKTSFEGEKNANKHLCSSSLYSNKKWDRKSNCPLHLIHSLG